MTQDPTYSWPQLTTRTNEIDKSLGVDLDLVTLSGIQLLASSTNDMDFVTLRCLSTIYTRVSAWRVTTD